MRFKMGSKSFPPVIGIRIGKNLAFDAQAPPLPNSCVVISATIKNECGGGGGTDRCTDFEPTGTRADQVPAPSRDSNQELLSIRNEWEADLSYLLAKRLNAHLLVSRHSATRSTWGAYCGTKRGYGPLPVL